ncbi:Origin recognition complex subunit 2 [Pseudogymnoascus verrucosus]|uniref:Origin recognition complex subunit 2 n=1 Tax=Pseudogymnoascus verrucosus TaxID=342668 RepID=A0A1B8GNJ3_9PEZI|nr:Origin recognition complex subunit 2 [Pseudogymnoascus verrucosus]OBT97414.1 Origin recognition complex subunit 2 [Pseudogymnoascus verrucosus]
MKRKSFIEEDSDLDDVSSRKRARSQQREDLNETDLNVTPSKPRPARPQTNGASSEKIGIGSFEDAITQESLPIVEAVTPKRGRGRPKGSKNFPKPDGATPTPKKLPKGKTLFATPSKPLGLLTPSKARNAADRSARRKSTRTLIERTINGEASSDEDDDVVSRYIYDSDKEEQADATESEAPQPEGGSVEPTVPETPSKRGRGRPKGSKNRIRTPSPPRDMPPHELFFAQNRGAAMKTSNNNLSSLRLLDHEEYFTLLRSYEDPHAKDLEFLSSIHERSFPQWDFELSQNFNICLYGWGSKRELLTSYANHIYAQNNEAKIVVVNGYNPSTSMRDVLNTIFSLIPNAPKKLGTQPSEVLDRLLTHLSTSDVRITLLVHSLDGQPIRRAATQSMFARLAAHPQISVIASTDHPSFPLLWDSSARTSFNFLFHDCTTFSTYSAEVDVVDSVLQLLGRSGRRVGGKEGVGFVLRSLPVNARSLFKILCVEQLMVMDADGEMDGFGGGDDEDGDEEGHLGERMGGSRSAEVGVEYRALYQKAVEDFVCGDEVSFRSLLKEFHDHQMITSRKDALGTEILSIPFRREELEAILEDLMS